MNKHSSSLTVCFKEISKRDKFTNLYILLFGTKSVNFRYTIKIVSFQFWALFGGVFGDPCLAVMTKFLFESTVNFLDNLGQLDGHVYYSVQFGTDKCSCT